MELLGISSVGISIYSHMASALVAFSQYATTGIACRIGPKRRKEKRKIGARCPDPAQRVAPFLGWAKQRASSPTRMGRGAGSVCKGSVSTGLERYRWGLGVDAH